MASGTSISFHYFVRLPLTALGKKRSADEADVATREDGAKRRESTGSGGLKVRVSLGDSGQPGISPFHMNSHIILLRSRGPSQRQISKQAQSRCMSP